MRRALAGKQGRQAGRKMCKDKLLFTKQQQQQKRFFPFLLCCFLCFTKCVNNNEFPNPTAQPSRVSSPENNSHRIVEAMKNYINKLFQH